MPNSVQPNIRPYVVMTTLTVDEAINSDRRAGSIHNGAQQDLQLPSGREQTLSRMTDSSKENVGSYTTLHASKDALKIGRTYSKLRAIMEHLCVSFRESFPGYIFDVPKHQEHFNGDECNTTKMALFITAIGRNHEPVSDEVMTQMQKHANELLEESRMLISKINEAMMDQDVSGVILCRDDRKYSYPIVYKNDGVARFVYALYNADSSIINHLQKFRVGHEVPPIPALGMVENNVLDETPRKVMGKVRLESDSKYSFKLSGTFKSNQGGYEEVFDGVVHCASGYPTEECDWFPVLNTCSTSAKEVVVVIDSIKKYVSLQGHSSKKYIVLDVKVL